MTSFIECTKDFYAFVATLRMSMLTRTRLDKCKFTILPFFVLFAIEFVFQSIELYFLLSQLQITVILLLPSPLNPENPNLFFSIA